MKIILMFIGLLLSNVVYGQQKPYTEEELFVIRSSAPTKLWELLNTLKLPTDYDVCIDKLNPFYLWGDFDSDGKQDYVVRLKQKYSKKESKLCVLLGKGINIFLERNDKLEYPTLDAWYIVPKSEPVSQGVEEDKPPVLFGDAIMIVHVETSSSLIYWNGKRFVSYWQGD